MKYGVISDLHGDPRVIIPAIQVLKSNGAERLVLNGDIGELESDLRETQARLAFILTKVGESGLESYVQPGSHEIVPGFRPVVEHFAEKYDNIFSISRAARMENEDHHLIFLPGSDAVKGEYALGTELPTGDYIQLPEGVVPADAAKELLKENKDLFRGFLCYQNMNDLKDIVADVSKTIVFCHVPRRFKNLYHCIDVAEYGIVKEDFVTDIIQYADGEVQAGCILKPKQVKERLLNQRFEKDKIMPKAMAEFFIEARLPVELREENMGNKELEAIYNELGIRKAVSGHIHESGLRANDCSGKHVNEGEFVDELFWNSGCLSNGQTGILAVEGEKVSYHNIKLEL